MDEKLYCPYCGNEKGDKLFCCGENHFGTREECGFNDEPEDDKEIEE